MIRPMGTVRRSVYGLLAISIALVAIEMSLRFAGFVVLNKGRWFQSAPTENAQFRVLCLGDSYTYGIGTEPTLYSWPRQLETTIRRENPGLSADIYNRGVPGRSSSEVLAELPAHLETIRPHVVCILVGINNFWNFRDDPVRTNAERMLAESRIYRGLQVLVGRLSPDETSDHSILSVEPQEPDGSVFAGASVEVIDQRWVEASRRWASDIEAITTLIRSSGAELVVVAYPEHLADVFMMTQEKTCQDLNIPFVPVMDAFIDIGNTADPTHPLISADGHHPNGAGYGLVAELAYSEVCTAASRSRIEWNLEPSASAPAPSIPDYDTPNGQRQLRQWAASSGGGKRVNPGQATKFALILADAGRTAEAVTLLENIVNLHPARSLAATSLSRLYQKTGETEKERQLCRRVLDVRPTDDYFQRRWDDLEANGQFTGQGTERTTRSPSP